MTAIDQERDSGSQEPELKRVLVARDALDLMLGDAEAQAIKPAVARATAVLGAPDEVTLAPDGLFGWQTLYRTLQGYAAWQEHGPWITGRKPELGAQTKAVLAEVGAGEIAREPGVGRRFSFKRWARKLLS